MSKVTAGTEKLFGKLWIAVIPVLLGSVGYTGYDQYSKRTAVATVTVDVVVESNDQVKDWSPEIKAAMDAHKASHH